MGATKSFISKFNNPWEQLTFHYTGTQGKVFNAHEDRCVCTCMLRFLGRTGGRRLGRERAKKLDVDVCSVSDGVVDHGGAPGFRGVRWHIGQVVHWSVLA